MSVKISKSFLARIISLVIIISNVGFSGQLTTFPIESSLSPRFWSDLCFYKGSKGLTQVEYFYSVKLKELTFKEINDENLAFVSCLITVKDTTNKIIIEKAQRTAARNLNDNKNSDDLFGIIDLIVFDLPAGKYSYDVTLKDEHSQITSKIELPLIVPEMDKSLCMSNPLFALHISSDLPQKKFIKGNRVILPNSSRSFLHQKSILQFYFEVYNLYIASDAARDSFNVSYVITDSLGDSLMYIPRQSIEKPGASCAKFQKLDIRGMSPGEYSLTVHVSDPKSSQEVRQSEKFWILVPPDNAPVLSMTEENIKKYREQIQYFATDDELQLFEKLGPEGKANFLIEFWRSKDLTPETSENEFMQDCFSRIEYAREHFKGKGSGVNSDMGRIFIVYGQPDDIEKHVMEMNSKPYIIWHYFSTGSGKHIFVFVDQNNTGIYQLVHSTVENEIKNSEWMERDLR